MKSKRALELTLAILKPHVIKSPFALQSIRDVIIKNDFKVIKSQRIVISENEASLFYADHKGKFFYNRLLTFMTSGPSDVHILAGHDAIARWRKLLGPTKVYKAQFSDPDSIRGTFGLSDTRNAAHGSDSKDSAEREIAIFFKDFDIQKWYETEEDHYIFGKLDLDPTTFVHTINKSL
ncbi:nucleoside diphosphate kinase 6-like [Leptopilina boulardi]|uniref:nucleoside diphosphate kinase 6-like n=1 Tax=Leptopilina boulardi TaxID=63433 RepID=UPI0021F5D83F|nr:nucleoside diphosphate kinase 6-like [Leptopilina boulardi]